MPALELIALAGLAGLVLAGLVVLLRWWLREGQLAPPASRPPRTPLG